MTTQARLSGVGRPETCSPVDQVLANRRHGESPITAGPDSGLAAGHTLGYLDLRCAEAAANGPQRAGTVRFGHPGSGIRGSAAYDRGWLSDRPLGVNPRQWPTPRRAKYSMASEPAPRRQ